MQTVEMTFRDGARPIDGYGPGAFRIAGELHRGPLAVLPGGLLAWAGLHDLSIFADRADEIDVLLVGLGATLVQPGADFLAERARLEAVGIGVEFMVTPSACRTYNVLLAEGRRVAAALVPV